MFLYFNFCNIRCLRSSFQSVKHHLSSTKSHFLFLTETQVSEAADSSQPFVCSLLLSLFILVPELDVACMWATN